MANNYSQFSFEIPDLTEAEIAWLNPIIGLDPEDDDPDNPVGIGQFGEDAECFGANVVIDEGNLWIYAEESGTPEDAANFVQAFLAQHRPDDCVGFEAAFTCSRPRVDEFSGVAALVTATGQRWNGMWLAEQVAEHKRTLTVKLDEEARAFLADGGYATLEDWARDSDYFEVDGSWYTLGEFHDEGHRIMYEQDLVGAFAGAMEAAALADEADEEGGS